MPIAKKPAPPNPEGEVRPAESGPGHIDSTASVPPPAASAYANDEAPWAARAAAAEARPLLPLSRPPPPDLEPRRLRILARYGRDLSRTLDASRVYTLMLNGALLLTGARGAALCLYREDQDAEVAAVHDLPDDFLVMLCALRPHNTMPDATLVASLVNAHPAGALVNDLRTVEASLPPRFFILADHHGLRRILAIALTSDHEATGLLFLAAPSDAPFDDDDVAAVGLLIDQGGVALRNAQLYLQTARWAQRLAVLQAIGTEISASLNLREVLYAVVRRATDLLEASLGIIALWIPTQQILRVEVACSGGRLLEPQQYHYTLGQGLIGRAAQERRPQMVRDYQTWEHAQPGIPAEGLHSLVAVPLVWQEELLGVLSVGDRRADRSFTDEDMTLMTLLGQQAAGAVANARLYERAQQKLYQLNVLQDTSRAIIEQLDYDQILHTVLHNASALLGTHMAAVFVGTADPNLLQIRSAVGIDPDYVRDNRVALGTGAVGRAVALGKPVAITDILTEDRPEEFAQALVLIEWRSVLAVPLISQGVVQGGLCVYSAEPRTWTVAEAELLMVFASQAANAMHNATLFDRLRAEKATLLTTLQSMNDGIIVTDAAGRVILANPVAERLFEVPFPAHIGAPLVGLLRRSPYPIRSRPDDAFPASLDRVLGEGQVIHAELQVEREETLSLEHSLLPILGPEGAIMGAVAVFHDITELKKLDRLKSDFISMVSHELRTPLTSIKGFIKLILVEELGPITPQQRECLSVADQEADHLTHLINDLLDNSRIEAGRIQFTWAPVAPAELLAQVAQTLRPQAAERRLALDCEVPATLPSIRADRQRLIQILTNLVENALKFTPPGGRVHIGAEVEGGMLLIWVTDTGVGIPAHALERVFDRFYQVDEGGRARSGTGLGLSIAKQLVELHGGRIWAMSRPGQGTTFAFTLPLAEADLPAPAADAL